MMETPAKYERFRADGIVLGGTHRVIVRSDEEAACQELCDAIRNVFLKHHLEGAKGKSLKMLIKDIPYYIEYEKLG